MSPPCLSAAQVRFPVALQRCVSFACNSMLCAFRAGVLARQRGGPSPGLARGRRACEPGSLAAVQLIQVSLMVLLSTTCNRARVLGTDPALHKQFGTGAYRVLWPKLCRVGITQVELVS